MPAVETAVSGISSESACRRGALVVPLVLGATLVWLLGAGTAARPVRAAQGGDSRAQPTQAATTKQAAAEKKTSTPAERLKTLRQQAEKGNAEAQYRLAVMYRTGKGVPQNDAEAVEWYRKAADKGHAGAQNNLGWMYYSGKGMPQDEAEAAKWFRKAAEQGDVDAQYNLGMMYQTGRGVPRDDAEAVSWFRKAAEQGDVSAQYTLGLMYERGLGVPKGDVDAHVWLDLAATRSTGERQKKYAATRDAVRARLSAAEIAEAQKKTRAWLDAFRKLTSKKPPKQ